MATNCSCTELEFVGLVGDAFYFDDFQEDEVDTDTFEYSRRSQYWFRCSDSKYLIFNDNNQFDRRDLNDQQRRLSVYKLNMNIYTYPPHQGVGRAVMLYALKDTRRFAAVCKNDKEVGAEEVMILDGDIADSQHKAVFYMIGGRQPNKYKLKSSLYPDKVLGFDESDSNKLILCPDDPDSQDDLIEITEN